MKRKEDHINILLMPTDICNMNCVYCFHETYHHAHEKMSMDILKKIYDAAFSAYSDVSIIWHGGEPLVMGIDFFRRAVAMQKNYDGVKIRNTIQSNLTLLTEEYADFFKDNNFGVGTSYDGVCNDKTRGQSQKILQNRMLLQTKGIRCGCIMVVSQINIDYLIESYEFFNKERINFTINLYVQIPGNEKGLCLNPYHATKRLIELYRYWSNDSCCNVNITYFERILNYLYNHKKNVCCHTSCLGKWIAIRYNGNLSPCNRYFPNEYSYGNILQYERLSEAFQSKGFINLTKAAIKRREKCKVCNVFELCAGGCNNVALNENGIENNGGLSCTVLKELFEYIKHDYMNRCIENKLFNNNRLNRFLK